MVYRDGVYERKGRAGLAQGRIVCERSFDEGFEKEIWGVNGKSCYVMSVITIFYP